MSAKFKNGITIDGGNIDTASGQVYKINGTTVLSSTQVLGKGFSTTAGDIATIDAIQTLTNKSFPTLEINGSSSGSALLAAPAVAGGTAYIPNATGYIAMSSSSSNTVKFTPSTSTTVTLPTGATSTLARTDAGQTFTGSQVVQAAATQDSVTIAGRVGGSNSYSVTITPTTLSANRTLTLANGDTTLVAGTMAPTASPTFTGTVTTGLTTAGVVKTSSGGVLSSVATLSSSDLSSTSSSEAVATANIQDSAVTAAKIADASITGGTAGTGVKIAATTITNANISTTANIAPTKIQQASVMLTPSVAQTVPNASQTNLALDTVTNYGSYSGILAGTAGSYSSGTHTTAGKITASVACAVSASGFILWTNTTTNIRALVIRRYNSSNALLETIPISQIPQGAAFTATAGTVNFIMSTGDYIMLTGYQNSGGVLGYSTTNTSAFLRVTVLGGGV
jgi:hypothetical protein